MKLFDVVRLTEDVPQYNLHKGMVGTIVTLFDDPELAYEVEFADEHGETLCELALKPAQVELCQPLKTA